MIERERDQLERGINREGERGMGAGMPRNSNNCFYSRNPSQIFVLHIEPFITDSVVSARLFFRMCPIHSTFAEALLHIFLEFSHSRNKVL